ncbi:MAG: transketolase [Candidatus Eremiobacteraeota bacterium]|nr:transketolase [Candidatus Eremiobacteraeota bacterium]
MRKAAMQSIYRLAQRDPRVVFIGSDLGAGTLDEMRETIPERWIMEGVSEANVIGMAAGLAMEGFVPYVNTIATFLTRRCYEQIAIDLCLHNLPVRLIATGGGGVYAPLGPTHMAVEDLAIMRALPNMTVVAPVDPFEMERAMDASLEAPGPMYLRIAKGGEAVVTGDAEFALGKAVRLRAGRDVAFVGTGVMSARALAAAELLAADGIDAAVLHVHTLKPLDVAALEEAVRGKKLVVSVEEHTRVGGLGSAVAEVLAERGAGVPLLRLGLADRFSRDYGNQDHVLSVAGLQPVDLRERVRERLLVGAGV